MKIVNAIRPVTEKGGGIAMTTAEKLRQEGRQEGLYAALQIMIKNGMTDESIAKVMNLDLDLIKKILNKEQVEIPLHLLS